MESGQRMKCPSTKKIKKLRHGFVKHAEFLYLSPTDQVYPKNEINTPAATADPITPEILLDIQ